MALQVCVPDGLELSRLEKKLYANYIQRVQHFESVRIVWPKGEKRALRSIYIPARLCRTGGPYDALGYDVIDIHKVLGTNEGPVLITGEPGSGKSILARYIINRVLSPLDRVLDPNLRDIGGRQPGCWVPIFLDCSSRGMLEGWSQGEDVLKSFEEWLAFWLFKGSKERETQSCSTALFTAPIDLMSRALQKRRKKKLDISVVAEKLLRKIFEGGYALLVIDGLEYVINAIEVRSEAQAFVSGINAFAEKYGAPSQSEDFRSNLVVVMSRPAELTYFQHWSRFHLLPLAPTYHSRRVFLENLLDERQLKDKEDCRSQVIADAISRSDARVRDLAANPVLLSMFAYVLSKECTLEDALQVLQHNLTRVDIFNTFVDKLWKESPLSKYRPVTKIDAKEILGRLAYQMLDHQPKRLSCGMYELDRLITDIFQHRGNIDRHKVSTDLIDRAGYLVLVDLWTFRYRSARLRDTLGIENKTLPSSAVLTFLHFTFQEFFAYCYLDPAVGHSDSPLPPEAIIRRVTDPWWREVVVMTLSRFPETPELVQRYARLSLSSEVMDFERKSHHRQYLARVLEKGSRQDLKHICFNLEINYDDLPNSGVRLQARSLIEHCERRERYEELVAAVEALYFGAVGYIGERVRAIHRLVVLFLLARILQEYQLAFRQRLCQHQHEADIFDSVREEIVSAIVEQGLDAMPDMWSELQMVRHVPIDGLFVVKSPLANGAAGGEPAQNDWEEIEKGLASDSKEKRENALRLCALIGGDRALEIALSFIGDPELSKIASDFLRATIEHSASYLLEVITNPNSDRQKRIKAIDILSASDDPRMLPYLVSLMTTETPKAVLEKARQAVVSIAYDKHSDILHPDLINYLYKSDETVRAFVSDALVHGGEIVIPSLGARLRDPYARPIHDSVVIILARIGGTYANVERVSKSYKALITSFITTFAPVDHCRFALRILEKTGQDWAVPFLTDIWLGTCFRSRWCAVGCLTKLLTNKGCKQLRPFICALLEDWAGRELSLFVKWCIERTLARV